MPREFVVAADLGQAHDYTALAVIERVGAPQPAYHLGHLERFRRRPYPWVVERVGALVADVARTGGAWVEGDRRGPRWAPARVALVVDKTGVGAAVTDRMREVGLRPVDVTITAGATVNPADHGWTVPKVDLATVTQLVLQQGRLRFAAGLPELEALKRELANFRVRITLAGRVSFAAAEEWRMGDGHDDLVLAVSLAVWYAEHRAAGGNLAPVPPEFGAALANLIMGEG